MCIGSHACFIPSEGLIISFVVIPRVEYILASSLIYHLQHLFHPNTIIAHLNQSFIN